MEIAKGQPRDITSRTLEIEPNDRREIVATLARDGIDAKDRPWNSEPYERRVLVSLLDHLAAPGCPRLGLQWDRCGVHYVEPIVGGYASSWP